MNFVAWHGKTQTEHVNLTNQYQSKGYGFISLSVYGATTSPYYAAVMVNPSPGAQHTYPVVPGNEWQQIFNSEAAHGYGPVIIAATGPASGPIFAAVFQPQNPIPLTRNGLGSGSASDTSTLQGMDAQAKSQGLILRWAASYGDSSGQAFAAVWVPNSGQTLWNNDGITDSASYYQQRFDAENSGWARPAFVTLNTSAQYLPLFVDDQIGPWQARHGLTPAGYQTEFDTWTKQGYFPICVQAAGPDSSSATFAAIFAKSQRVVAKPFLATGPVANAQIDAVVQQAMQNYGVRHASLAIVQGTQLVYARGYTMAEAGWPTAEPTTCFRLASVSKLPTAIAIYQLIQAGKLNLSATAQSILGLKTPSGGAPTDSRFSEITVKQLLEHTSGLNAGASEDGVAVRNAFNAAGHAATLPVSAAMTDSYIASIPLVSNPGATQNYHNCGYHMLARIVAKLRNQSRPIDAYQQYLFSPLSINRIRRAVSLVADQPSDEGPLSGLRPARVQERDVRSPAAGSRHVWEYSTRNSRRLGRIERRPPTSPASSHDTNSQKDNPAIERATLKSGCLTAASQMTAAGNTRAGYGLDSANDLGGESSTAKRAVLWDDLLERGAIQRQLGFYHALGKRTPWAIVQSTLVSGFPHGHEYREECQLGLHRSLSTIWHAVTLSTANDFVPLAGNWAAVAPI